MALQVKESPWDQKGHLGQGAFHTVDFIQKVVSTNVHQQISAPGGFQFTLNFGIWRQNILFIFILSAPSEPDPTFTHQETTKQLPNIKLS